MGRPKGSKNLKKNPNENRGGVRPGAGRKPKSDEFKLIERLDNIIDKDEVLKELKKMALGYDLVVNENGVEVTKHIYPDLKAITIYMNYRFGKPKETKDINLNTEQPLFSLDDE